MAGETAKKQPTAREAALKALVRVERDGAYLNFVLSPLLEGLSSRERALAFRIATGSIQHLNTVDWALNHYLKNPLEKLTPSIRNILRLSAYQLLYLDRVPVHSCVDEGVRLAQRYGHRGVVGLVNAVLRRLARQGGELPWPDPHQHSAEYLSLRHSHPLWLVRRWIKRYGPEETEALCQANNKIVHTTLRPNSLRIDADQLQEQLREEGVETESSSRVSGMLKVTSQQSLADLASFQSGFFTIQGESSALIAPLLNPMPGQEVLDLCSAPGGKTTHLAELMGDSGIIHAVDLHSHRLQLVDSAARRLDLTSIRTHPMDGRKIAEAGLPLQDRILVDAPCTGLGVIRRLPELKWRRREENFPEMQKLQLALLCAAAPLLKPGGTLLYSVCTNELEETAEVVKHFSSSFPQLMPHREPDCLPEVLSGVFTADGTATLMPHLHGLDGFFIALWTCKKP